MRSNAVAWNPQEPMNFVCANEDTNLYTFDLRNLNQVTHARFSEVVSPFVPLV